MPEKTNINKLEQGRAEFAYQCAKKANIDLKEKAGDYKPYAKKIPMMIKTNGLGSALAFIKSKSKSGHGHEAYSKLYKQISEWLQKEEAGALIKQGDDLVFAVIDMESSDYRATTVEVFALFNWLRRFAEGLIDS